MTHVDGIYCDGPCEECDTIAREREEDAAEVREWEAMR
jgi:hypothetical protein